MRGVGQHLATYHCSQNRYISTDSDPHKPGPEVRPVIVMICVDTAVKPHIWQRVESVTESLIDPRMVCAQAVRLLYHNRVRSCTLHRSHNDSAVRGYR